MKDCCRSEESNALAEIWHRHGPAEEAHALIIDTPNEVLKQSHTAASSDRKLSEDCFQDRASAYLRIFPGRWDDEIRCQGNPFFDSYRIPITRRQARSSYLLLARFCEPVDATAYQLRKRICKIKRQRLESAHKN
jgi:hypothetical protein